MALNDRDAPPLATAQPTAQLVYATLLDWGARIGFLLLVAGFAVYLLGWLPPHVPVEQLPGLWNQPVSVYLQRTGTPPGWVGVAHLAVLLAYIGVGWVLAERQFTRRLVS